MSTAVAEGNVKPGGQQDVVLLFACGRIGYVNVAKRILPAEPFADLCDRAEIERAAIFTPAREVGVEVKTLGNDGAAAQLVREFFPETRSCEVAR